MGKRLTKKASIAIDRAITNYRKKALITMVTCVITCIIGFGICANNFSLGAMH